MTTVFFGAVTSIPFLNAWWRQTLYLAVADVEVAEHEMLCEVFEAGLVRSCSLSKS